MNNQFQSLDQVKASILDMAIKFGPKLLVAIIILVAGYMVGRWAGGMLERLLVRFKLEAPVRSLLVRTAEVLVIGLFAIMALQNLGVELLPLIAGLGVAGAGIALAMQGLLGNVAAGLTIIFTQPFRVGDYISIAKEEGEVLDISLFSTTSGWSVPGLKNDPKPQDRRRDSAQLRPDPATQRGGERFLWDRCQHRLERSRRNTRVPTARYGIQHRESGSPGSPTPASPSASIRGSMCPTTSRR